MLLVKRQNSLFVVLVIFLLQLGIFVWTNIRPTLIAPPNTAYMPLRGHLVYTSLIRQARDGAWAITIPHTTRPGLPVYYHMFFVFLGKISALTGIEPQLMYMLSRIAAAAILFVITYWLISLIIPRPYRWLAIIFILGLEPGPLITHLSSQLRDWQPAIFSYYSQVSTFRHFGLPHHTLGEALGLATLGLLISFLRHKTPLILGLITIMSFLATTVLPPYMFILVTTVISPWFIYSLITSHLSTFPNWVPPLVAVTLPMLGVSLFVRQQVSSMIQDRNFNQTEKYWVTPRTALINYFSSLLLYFPPTILSLITPINSKKSSNLPTVFLMWTWIILPLTLLPLVNYPWFPLASFRLVDGYAYFPAGILATLGIIKLNQLLVKQIFKVTISISLTVIIIASFSLTILYSWQVLAEQNHFWTNVYLSRDEWQAMSWLEQHATKGSGIMVRQWLGEIIPEYANVRTFLGSTPGYHDWAQRELIAQNFFSGLLDETSARQILLSENIDYIWWGRDEKSLIKSAQLYPGLLTPVYTGPNVIIFSYQK